MRKKLIVLLVFLLLLTGCKGKQNLSMDGDSKAKEYFQTHYNSDIKNIKIDFIDF